jgi:ABC-type thiamin/hydroxymethylpyrimidine transport system permease subunit
MRSFPDKKERFLVETQEPTTSNKFYFSTRDLLIMAVLAALGGVASTYINTLSDAVQALLGFPGATQWAAGLHVIWIVLAFAITGKPGTGTLTGILKGSVELLSGNSHGIIILLIDLVAGLLVDFGFLLFRNRRSIFAYLLAGGLATGSNVLVFQIFATLPSNILAATAILALFLVAFASGLVFAGLVPSLLVNALRKAGVVRTQQLTPKTYKAGWFILAGVFIIAMLLAVFLKVSLQGPEQIQVNGDVDSPYDFPLDDGSIEKVTRQMDYKGVLTEYDGYLIKDIIDDAHPASDADTLLIEATDGYAFLIGFDELFNNNNILLVQSGSGKNATYDVVGPKSSKAWVRGISRLTVIASKSLIIIDQNGNEHQFDPDAWVSDMDSTQVSLPEGSKKLQGVPVWKVVEANIAGVMPAEVLFSNEEGTLTLPWGDIDKNDNLRIFTVIGESSISYALAEMSGDVQLYPITQIEIH